MTPLTRNLALAGALLIIAFLAFFVFAAIAQVGLTGLTLVSAGIVIVLGFGVIGALTHRPDD